MKNFRTQFLAILFFGVLALPAYAAELTLEIPLAAVSSTIQIPVVFTAGEETINVVEGSIGVPEGMTIERIDTSSSAFPLFASGPTYVPASRTIEFTAGALNGIAARDVALLFVLHARAEKESSYTLTPKSIHAYANDGIGTKLAVATVPTQVIVGEKGSVHTDIVPKGTPKALIAEIGKDDSLFEGKWFAAFFGSSAHYEVREGWWRFPERADRYYVLKDQNLRTTVWVTAADEQGKRVTTMIPATHPWAERAVLLALSLLAALCAYLAYRRLQKRTS